MIAQLRGKIVSKKPPYIVVEVNGIGYELQSSTNTIYLLPAVDQDILIYTHFVVREDAQLLYGFIDEAERSIFRELIKVSGVGPKLALAILSGISASGFMQAIDARDPSRLVSIPGVGKKTAERLIIEMTGKLSVPSTGLAQDDAVSALVALGYKHHDAQIAIRKVMKDDADSQALIRSALQSLAK